MSAAVKAEVAIERHEGRLLYRYADVDAEVRGIDEKTRTATFVISTERAVDMGWGAPEILRHGPGADFDSYAKNPIVLNAHRRDGYQSILGLAPEGAKVVGKRGVAALRFDETPEGEGAWARVKSGSLRAVSIGYSVDPTSIKHVDKGQTFEGFRGPASVVGKWRLMEISVVPIGADADALLRRSLYAGPSRKEGAAMGLEFSNIEQPSAAQPPPPPPPAPAPTPAPGTLPEERAQRVRAAVDAQIRSMAPRDLVDVAEDAILSGLDVEGARAAMKTARAARSKPVGTPEPVATPAAGATTPAPEMTADVVLRALTGLRS